jgi:hypothetical protein
VLDAAIKLAETVVSLPLVDAPCAIAVETIDVANKSSAKVMEHIIIFTSGRQLPDQQPHDVSLKLLSRSQRFDASAVVHNTCPGLSACEGLRVEV